MSYKSIKSVISNKIVGVNKTVELEGGGTTTISIPADNDNRDYKEYLAWVAEGNTPEDAD